MFLGSETEGSGGVGYALDYFVPLFSPLSISVEDVDFLFNCL